MKKVNLVGKGAAIKWYTLSRAKWYLNHRTKIWSTIFLIMGLFGGNIMTVQKWIPTLKYKTEDIQLKLDTLKEIQSNLVDIQKQLDQLTKE